MNRRELLAGAGALTIAGCGPQASQQAAGSASTASVALKGDPFAGAKLMADVETYVRFGLHRTGSEGDVATSDWFAKRWGELGYEIEQTAFPTPNADTTVARLEVGGQAFDGFAQPPLSFTSEAGITAPLAMWNPKSVGDVASGIAVVYIERQPGAPSPGAAYRQAFEAAAKAGAVGIIGLTSGPSGEVVAINTPPEMYLETPVLCLGEKEKAKLDPLIAAHQPAKLVIRGPGGFRNGKNTIARRGTAGPWVVVSTPQSGWFTCGGERGPGIAMSLALSAWAAAQTFPCRFLFVATSGHEWTDTGAHAFHQVEAPDPTETALWFHLGASFGARGYEESTAGLVPIETVNLARTLMASEDMLPVCQAAFAGQPVIEQPLKADAARALGEYKLVVEEGYPTSAGFWGAHGLFHTPTDGSNTTSGAIMEPIVRAIAKVIEARVGKL
jgi:hypothetical protein